VQTALILVLFLGSLAALLVNSLAVLRLPQREQEVRAAVLAASRRLAGAAAPVAGESRPSALRLREIAERVLAEAPGVEGGFFVAGEVSRFTAYAFPTQPHPPPPGAEPAPRQDPPPLEEPYIRLQALRSIDQPAGAAHVQPLDVGPSRVVIATEPVGTARPARLVTWAMVRLTGPEQQLEQRWRYQVSAGLALGGIALALALTVRLGHTLRRERRERERLAEELRRAEHLAVLGRLLAGVAHEVRTPLAGIRSTVQLWQRLPESARTPQSQEAVLQAVDRLNALVSRLLYFARAGHEERRPVDLNAVVREVLELLRAQAEGQNVRCEADLQPDLPAVSGTAPALQQVVLNLATNAVQVMPRGGRLWCRTEYRPGAGQVELRVGDTGPGIPAEARAHLFEPFFTTREEGAGLGLALCREIVRQHGGSIELEEGPGAVFRVVLPVGA
jgi:two-component system, NtrC family, sensor histidine kinase HydH